MESPNLSWQQRGFAWSIKNKSLIFWLFRFNYFLVGAFFFLALYTSISNSEKYFSEFYDLGVGFGRMAILLLGVVVIPGMLGRFCINFPITRVITFFRRQLGITVFLYAFVHYGLVKSLPIISGAIPFVFPYAVYEMFGLFTLLILFVMYLTSNNWSMKRLGKWWKWLHRLVYLVLWLLVLHTGLQGVSIWSVLIFTFAVIEIVSLIYVWIRNKSKKQTPLPIGISQELV